ncbi:MAG: nucleotidyltransferase domain-containing protein [Nitrospirae bacterium]|nr:nucleotidyltransferase domain-containing protein [Nitrospirota bacterium]
MSLFSKEKKILSDIAEALSHEPSILKLIAYGSRVRGDFHGDSDLDVFVLVDKKTRYIKEKIIDIFYKYEMSYDISFSISIFSKDEFDFNNAIGSPFIKAIKAEGVIIYDAQLRREKVPLKV